jgi:hypothetical protein
MKIHDIIHRTARERAELDDLERRIALRASVVKEALLASHGYDLKQLGPNEKEQQRRLEFTVLTDEAYVQMVLSRTEKRRNLAHLDAEYESYKEYMRAAQWSVRQQMVLTLQGKVEDLAPHDRIFDRVLETFSDSNLFPQEEVRPATDLT